MKLFKFTFWCAKHTGVYRIIIKDERKSHAYLKALQIFGKYVYENDLNIEYIKIECEKITL